MQTMIQLGSLHASKQASAPSSGLVFFLKSSRGGRKKQEVFPKVTECVGDSWAVFMSTTWSRTSPLTVHGRPFCCLLECLLPPNWGVVCGMTDCRERCWWSPSDRPWQWEEAHFRAMFQGSQKIDCTYIGILNQWVTYFEKGRYIQIYPERFRCDLIVF